jgi:fructokinase
LAKKNGLFISFDPNIRLGLWDSEQQAVQEILESMKLAKLVKISEEECEYLTGTRDPFQGADLLLKRYSMSIVLMTLGEKGSMAFTREGHVHAEAILRRAGRIGSRAMRALPTREQVEEWLNAR